jgi:hypothetical protein
MASDIDYIFDKLSFLEIIIKLQPENERILHEYNTLYKDYEKTIIKYNHMYKQLLDINFKIRELITNINSVNTDNDLCTSWRDKTISLNNQRCKLKVYINKHCSPENEASKKSKLFLIVHTELGDMINHCGMFRYFATLYDEVKIACRSNFIEQMEYMFDDCNNIKFHKLDRRGYNSSLISNEELEIIKKEYDILPLGFFSPNNAEYNFNFLPFVFYDMAMLPYSVFWDFYYFRITEESVRLYNILRDNNIEKYVFIHSSTSGGKVIDPEDIKYKLNLDYNNILFICTDYNIYTTEHKFYKIANEFVMKYVIDYITTIENASYIILSDSCIFCLSLHIPIKTKECYYANCRVGVDYSYIFDEKNGYDSTKNLPIFKRL